MKMKIVLTLLLMFLCTTAWAQPMPPATPPSPGSMGMQAPLPTYSTQSPPASESGQELVMTTQAYATAAAPPMAYATTTSANMIVPPGTSAPNLFYVPYYPCTVASCYFGQWVPLWLDIKGCGPLYIYEWYPNGRLVSRYMANILYPSWRKMWFYGDAAGWHTLQYYCNGWSNYIYVYVYGCTPPCSLTTPYSGNMPPAQFSSTPYPMTTPYSGNMPPAQFSSTPYPMTTPYSGNMPPAQFSSTPGTDPVYPTQLPAGSPTVIPYTTPY